MIDRAILIVDEDDQKEGYGRRAFLRLTATTAALLGTGSLLSSCFDKVEQLTPQAPAIPAASPPPAAAPALTDQDILMFAINLGYLESNFHSLVFTGSGTPVPLLQGLGALGTVTGGRKVTFVDRTLASYAEEIQQRSVQHLTLLRSQIGNVVLAMPDIDFSTGATGAFTRLAVAAGVVANGQIFDPFANDDNFLLGAYLFQDVMVTAYKSAVRLLPTKTYVEPFTGMLAAKSYHAGLLRALLYRRSLQSGSVRAAVDAIARYRDSLDGRAVTDRGVNPIGNRSSIAAVDIDGSVFGRTVGQVLNIVYNSNGAVKKGGFFPGGVPGVIATSGYGYVEKYDAALDRLIATDAVVEEVAGEFNWIEGPVWVGGADGYLLTSHPRDIFMTRFSERDGSSLYLQPSGAPLPIDPLKYAEPGSNGLFLGRGGLLVVDGSLRVMRTFDLQTKTFTGTIAERFEGKKFNSPNDICISPRDGGIFFTDPAYGLRGGIASPLREMDYTGVFRIGTDNAITLIGKYDRPNGIGISPDGSTLYLTDVTRGWIALTIDANGRPSAEREFIKRDAITGGDGLKIDAAGNMWASCRDGITIVDPTGKRLGTIRVNDTAANCEIGGDGYLYITSNRRLARIRVNTQKLLIPRFS